MKIFCGKQILLGLMLATLSGCVTYPIAKNLQHQARPVTLAEAAANPGAYQGTIVIWGGRIIKTVNDVNNSAVYVLCLPIDSEGRPVPTADSPGRFIASSKGFLDPEVYKSGRLLTVAGSIAGVESQPVQKSRYTYPVLDIKQIHFWPPERRYYYYPAGGGYYYPGWGWGWYPGWSWGWGWYYGGDWDRGYHYRGGTWDRDYDGGHRGGAYHYQGRNDQGSDHGHH